MQNANALLFKGRWNWHIRITTGLMSCSMSVSSFQFSNTKKDFKTLRFNTNYKNQKAESCAFSATADATFFFAKSKYDSFNSNPIALRLHFYRLIYFASDSHEWSEYGVPFVAVKVYQSLNSF